ncbi:TesA Lysophospholipase L1 and related esterases [Rhabdaerophilaceae bacterium]
MLNVFHMDGRAVLLAACRSTLAMLLGFAVLLDFGACAQARQIRLVALGDSLTAGYQLGVRDAFPAVLEAALRARGLDVVVENAGVSGDTATGGMERLDWSVPDGTDGVIVQLGANDALRGLSPVLTELVLDTILTRLKQRGIRVFLAGMLAPRNNGPQFTAAFDGMYPRLAAKHEVPLYPFFLEGVQGDPKLNLGDMMHPNPAGVQVIVARILPMMESFVRAIAKP